MTRKALNAAWGLMIYSSIAFLAGCSGFVATEQKFSKNHQTTGYHRVVKGETLYSIAMRYELSPMGLARANSIAEPYTIYPGQNLKLTAATKNAPTGTSTSSKTTANSTKPVVAAGSKNSSSSTKPVAETAKKTWIWPANGRLIAKFSNQPPINKGIDIEGGLGEPIVAAMAGTVVYAGQGLRGYGNLVIVKHDETFLSAYAHAKQIVVSEQQTVKAGEKIAEIGSTGTDKNKLHFEIRQNGQPVDPLLYLPKK